MLRAVKLSLKFATKRKRKALANLNLAYRKAVNFFIRAIWDNPGKLDKETLARLPSGNTRLSERYKSNALKHALSTVVATKRSAKALKRPCKMPVFTGNVKMDAKVLDIQEGRGSFDLVLRTSSLKKGDVLNIPTRKTAPLNRWLAVPGAKLKNGGELSEDAMIVWVEIPDQEPALDKGVLAVDLGVNKLITTSMGQFIGEDFKALLKKVRSKQPGSAAKRRALKERDNYIRKAVKELPWDTISTIVIENLKGIKRGKQKNRGRSFRKAMAPWVPQRVFKAIQERAQQNRVRVVTVSPAYTSQRCPACDTVSAGNRVGEAFKCVLCGYEQDADIVGARNVLQKAHRLIGSLESPMSVNALDGKIFLSYV